MYKIKDISNTILQGNTLDVLKNIPKESISCVVTSPPYFGLRDYGTSTWEGGNPKCNHFRDNKCKHANTGQKNEGAVSDDGIYKDVCKKCGAKRIDQQIGLEATFDDYINRLCDIFDEVKRVLRKDGTLWVNLGDTYNGTKMGNTNEINKKSNCKTFKKSKQNILPNKCLIGVPARFQIEMVNRGWILRNVIIWYKENCMPESTKDRFTRDFEYIFFFVKSNNTQYWINKKTGQLKIKQPIGIQGVEGIDWYWGNVGEDYYDGGTKIDVSESEKISSPRARTHREKHIKKRSYWEGHDYYFEQQFEDIQQCTIERMKRGISANNKWINGADGQTPHNFSQPRLNVNKMKEDAPENYNPLGRNKRCVWKINTKPFSEAHFAVFPMDLIEVPINAGCPEFICKKCGQPREKIYQDGEIIEQRQPEKGLRAKNQDELGQGGLREGYVKKDKMVQGLSDCGCNAGWKSGIVLDPFMGSGTAGLVAKNFRRKYIGIDLNPEYIKIANKRLAQMTLWEME